MQSMKPALRFREGGDDALVVPVRDLKESLREDLTDILDGGFFEVRFDDGRL